MSDMPANNDQLPHENKAVTNEMPAKRGRYGCIAVVGLAVMMLGFGLWYACFRSVPLRISPETTYITEPLTKDGRRVDYLAAWEQRRYPPEMATDDNGFRILLRAFGPAVCSDNPSIFDIYSEKLGLDSVDSTSLNYCAPKDFLKNKAAMISETELQRPWTCERFPVMEEWLEENQPALDFVAATLRRPTFSIPLVLLDENDSFYSMLFPGLVAMKDFAHGFIVRANYRVAAGRLDEAIDDIAACYRIGRVLGNGGSVLETFLGFSCEKMADAVPIAGSPRCLPTAKQLERLCHELEALPPPPDFDVAIEIERFMVLDAVQKLSRGNKNIIEFFEMSDVAFLFRCDWNTVAKKSNEVFDEMGEYDASMPDSTASKAARFIFVKKRSDAAGQLLLALLQPDFVLLRDGFHQRKCREKMKRMALALLIYERKHGDLPHDKWQDAVREILGETDPDFFRCPSSNAAPGETTYALAPDRAALIIESEIPVSPNTLVNTENPVPRVASVHSGGINVACRDGSVRFLNETVSEEDWQALFQPPENPTPE